jgi:hypothetical protein
MARARLAAQLTMARSSWSPHSRQRAKYGSLLTVRQVNRGEEVGASLGGRLTKNRHYNHLSITDGWTGCDPNRKQSKFECYGLLSIVTDFRTTED